LLQIIELVKTPPKCIIFAKKQINMPNNRTYSMVKPHAVADNHVGGILKMIEEGGFRIVALKKTQLTAAQAGKFYEVHAERPFYGELCEMMSAGPIVAMILEKENAVADFRALIGSTDPAEAAEGTVRKAYAKSKGENAVHGSDSDENAAIESAFFFSGLERY
jgi:nucleoside-diphosphate kinase